MSIPVLEYHIPDSQRPRHLFGLIERTFLIAFGVVLPLVCFGIAFRGYPSEPEWQSGEWDRYIRFIPDGRAGFPFYPLLIYCMVCLCCLVVRPALARRLVLRLGIYTGIILALQYTLIQVLEFESHAFIALAIGLASNFVLLGIIKLLERVPLKIVLYSAAGLATLFAVWILAVIFKNRSGFPLGAWPLSRYLVFAGVVCLIFAPAWCLGAYIRATQHVLQLNREFDQIQFRTSKILGWTAWLGGYAVAWKLSITNAIALYAALPTAPPGCYIATAAAHGHPRWVSSTPARAADGTSYRTNDQLRRLKCAELAMAVLWPAGHRFVRRIYDLIGPPLARGIRVHPLLADSAFVMLKPFEWLAFGLLLTIVPEVRLKIRQLYPAT